MSNNGAKYTIQADRLSRCASLSAGQSQLKSNGWSGQSSTRMTQLTTTSNQPDAWTSVRFPSTDKLSQVMSAQACGSDRYAATLASTDGSPSVAGSGRTANGVPGGVNVQERIWLVVA